MTERAQKDETYVGIPCRFLRTTPASVWIAYGKDWREYNIPRALIHGGDETQLDRHLRGTELTLRIFDWKARELGLKPGRDANAAGGDLFPEGKARDASR